MWSSFSSTLASRRLPSVAITRCRNVSEENGTLAAMRNRTRMSPAPLPMVTQSRRRRRSGRVAASDGGTLFVEHNPCRYQWAAWYLWRPASAGPFIDRLDADSRSAARSIVPRPCSDRCSTSRGDRGREPCSYRPDAHTCSCRPSRTSCADSTLLPGCRQARVCQCTTSRCCSATTCCLNVSDENGTLAAISSRTTMSPAPLPTVIQSRRRRGSGRLPGLGGGTYDREHNACRFRASGVRLRRCFGGPP